MKLNETASAAQRTADTLQAAASAPIFVQMEPTEADRSELDELNGGVFAAPLPPTKSSDNFIKSNIRKLPENDAPNEPLLHSKTSDSESEDPVERDVRELNGEPRPPKKFRRLEASGTARSLVGTIGTYDSSLGLSSSCSGTALGSLVSSGDLPFGSLSSVDGPGCAHARFSGFAFPNSGSPTEEVNEHSGYFCEGKSFGRIAIDTSLKFARR